ncbi:glutamate--tRNA ligase [Dactylosporangium sp. NPDC051484]|uniref:glutamate--tRNA ligase n=1 Tax=Dactylosporangium sp. NPDC051484 TaxID=3154942 RepID=UPI00344B42AD
MSTPGTEAPVRTRVAPSPTGDPHVGTAYAALFNLAFARKHGGQFILRVEDTDRTRYVEGSEQQVFDTLRWLGFSWDQGPDIGGPAAPYRQSERLPTYRVVAERLLAEGHAYQCWCSAERLTQMRERQQQLKMPTGYDRTCYGKTREERAELPGFTEVPVVRMLVPDEARISFTDLIRGEITPPQPDDQVLLKADGFPTYHLAVVVDDNAMGVTHVIRGEEWISSTAKHLLLYRWLGWQEPRYAHMPLLRNVDRSKISKRKNPAARLKWFQEEGYLPEALVNFLALMGYSMPEGKEIFTFDEVVESFDFARINPVGPVFDIDKLNWLNGHYLRSLDDDAFLRAAEPFLPGDLTPEDIRTLVVPLRERTKKLSELAEQLDWLATDTVEVRPADLAKHGLPAPDARTALEAFAKNLEELDPFEGAQITATLDRVVAELGLNRRRSFMTARLALVGKPVSPPLDDTMIALGAQRTVHRLRQAAAALEA